MFVFVFFYVCVSWKGGEGLGGATRFVRSCYWARTLGFVALGSSHCPDPAGLLVPLNRS